MMKVRLEIEIDAETPEQAARTFLAVLANDDPRPIYFDVIEDTDDGPKKHHVEITD